MLADRLSSRLHVAERLSGGISRAKQDKGPDEFDTAVAMIEMIYERHKVAVCKMRMMGCWRVFSP